ncbi:hypothetical protein [Paracoccus sp. SCSIO 75233]|uniref:hypothetical protein n=1 Tax=Paracoccus sp. SCSIO 75233 TaxID=3017782 RepID=UPI0022F0BFDF|nr:hypothetical protein [Paracoccus sp. SCSIO 75233]WBU55354.1 hypothetical protein PAF12_18605 [Paracoccus sp. SCSIO 75233]
MDRKKAKEPASPPNIKALKRTRSEIKKLQYGYRDALRHTLQEAAVRELAIRNNMDDLKAFCELDHWQGKKSRPSVERPEELRLFILKFVFSWRKNTDKDASRYNKAIEALLVDNVPREEIAAELKKRGGIQRVYADYRAMQQEGEKGGPIKKASARERIAAARATYLRTVQEIDADEMDLFLQVEPDDLEDLLNSSKGDKFTLRVRNAGADDTGFVQFKLLASDEAHEPAPRATRKPKRPRRSSRRASLH